MEVSRNRSWRPPANATTFSFGPWVTCHCAHGVVEEPEVRIHADEEIRRAPPQTKLRQTTGPGGLKTETDRFPSEFKKPLLQLPEAAIPEREDRKNGRETLSKATSSALKRVQLPAPVPTSAAPSRWKKVVTAALLFVVVSGLVLLAAAYPVAEHLSDEFKEYSCRISDPAIYSASEIPYFQYSLTPGVSCWVELEISKPCQESGCEPALQHAGWTVVTFENPKEFLSPIRKTCAAQVKRLPEHFKCFVAPSSEGSLVVLPRPAAAWEVETLLAARYTWAVLVWLLAWPLLCLMHLPGARCIPSKQFLLRFLRVALKVCAMALVFIALAGRVLLAIRYPAARHLRDELQDGTCQLTGAGVAKPRHWSLLPAVQCPVTVLKGDETAEALIFSYPTKWLDKQYHHLKCEDLVNSLDKSGFPCASSGKTLLEGHKADLPVVFLELMNLQFQHRVALDLWCISVLATMVMLLLYPCWRTKRQDPDVTDVYRRLSGDAR